MGLSSSKSSSTTTPVYSKEITGAANTVLGAYDTQAPKITSVTDSLGSMVPGLMDTWKNGDPNVNAASGFNSDVLSGKYLNSNPYLDGVINKSNTDIRNQSQASLGTHGLYGDSSAMADIVSRNLADNENNMRYANYQDGLGLMNQQAALTPQLAEAKYLPINAIGSIADAQQMPVQAASGMASSIGGLLGQYTNNKTTQSQSIGGLLSGIAGSALSGWASGGFKGIKLSDVRAKTDIRPVGSTNEGLGIYTYRYHGSDEVHMGVMAQEVAAKQPENLGPTIGGYMTVNVAGVR